MDPTKLTPTRCRKYRLSKELTQQALASSAGISHASIISNFENGRLVLADWQALRLTEALGLLRDDVREAGQVQVNE